MYVVNEYPLIKLYFNLNQKDMAQFIMRLFLPIYTSYAIVLLKGYLLSSILCLRKQLVLSLLCHLY